MKIFTGCMLRCRWVRISALPSRCEAVSPIIPEVVGEGDSGLAAVVVCEGIEGFRGENVLPGGGQALRGHFACNRSLVMLVV